MAQSSTSSKRESKAADAVLRLMQCLKQPDKDIVVRRQDIELILCLWDARERRRSGVDTVERGA